MANRNKRNSKPAEKVEVEAVEVVETVEPEFESQLPEVDTPTEMPEVKEPKPEGLTVLNVGKNPHLIDGKVIKHGEKITLTEAQAKNEKLMAKVNNAIKCNKLELVK